VLDAPVYGSRVLDVYSRRGARPGQGAGGQRAALVAAQVEAASAGTTPPAPQSLWKPPPHPTGMKVGRLRDVYLAIPDARRLDAWKRWCAQFPTQLEFPLGFKTCLPALLEAGDEKGVMTAHRLLAAAPEDKEIDGQSAAVSWASASLCPAYLAEADPRVNHAAPRQEWLARDELGHLLLAVQAPWRSSSGTRPGKPPWWPWLTRSGGSAAVSPPWPPRSGRLTSLARRSFYWGRPLSPRSGPTWSPDWRNAEPTWPGRKAEDTDPLHLRLGTHPRRSGASGLGHLMDSMGPLSSAGITPPRRRRGTRNCDMPTVRVPP